MTYTSPTTTEELELTPAERIAEHTGRTVLVDGFAYSTTAPERMRRNVGAVEHYANLEAEARS